MAITVGNQNVIIPVDVNKELLELKGELTDEQARISLAKFLRHNIGFTCRTILGIELRRFQEVILHGMFDRNFSMLVLGRGAGKTFLAAIYAILKIIFEPDSKIMIVSSTFRASRRIFNEIERILNRPEGALAAQCFRQPIRTLKRSDEWVMYIGGGCEGNIIAIPLSGDRVRGFRSNTLLIDEALTVDEETIKSVLMPFLNVPLDQAQRIQIERRENELIAASLLEEKDRIKFNSTSQMILLSSASYTFEYLYQTYKLYCDIIDDPSVLDKDEFADQNDKKAMRNSTYFVAQMSYQAIPKSAMDQGVIQNAKSQDGINSFKREYEAQFIDGGDGYFSPKKMMEATIPDGEYPTVKLVGDPEKDYILAIDPNSSNSKTADYYAMAVLELDKDKNGRDVAFFVHGYQKAGGSVKERLKYLYYLLNNFNIKLIICDNYGADNLQGEMDTSTLFKSYDKKIGLFNFDSDKEGSEWIDMLDQAKREYNFDTGNIFMKQYFSSNWILRANEYLVSCIEHKRLFFGGRSSAHPDIFDTIQSTKIPLELMFPPEDIDKADDPDDPYATEKMGVRDAFEQQDFIIKDVKDQMALITPKMGGISGVPKFDLPSNLKRQTSANRARKDGYTALLLACWGAKIYQDLKDETKTNKGKYADFAVPEAIVTTQFY